jgi:hypothetical protein
MGLPVQQNELRSVTVAARVQLANRPVVWGGHDACQVAINTGLSTVDRSGELAKNQKAYN